MSFENYCWWHLILTCKGQWLPGDPLGFRSRGHRIHSSGDYKRRPPKGEHEGLHDYHKSRHPDAVEIPLKIRLMLGQAILKKAIAIKTPCLAIAAGRAHTHLLKAMLNDWQHVKREVGRLKQAGSFAVRDVLPGQVWADGGKPIRINDREHQSNVFQYIVDHEQEGAWVWRYDGVDAEGDAKGFDPDLRCAQDRLLFDLLQGRV